jgi:hypothetical protein
MGDDEREEERDDGSEGARTMQAVRVECFDPMFVKRK